MPKQCISFQTNIFLFKVYTNNIYYTKIKYKNMPHSILQPKVCLFASVCYFYRLKQLINYHNSCWNDVLMMIYKTIRFSTSMHECRDPGSPLTASHFLWDTHTDNKIPHSHTHTHKKHAESPYPATHPSTTTHIQTLTLFWPAATHCRT